MKIGVFNKFSVALVLLCVLLILVSCANRQKAFDDAFFDVGGKKYSSVKVYGDPEMSDCAERLVDAFLSSTTLVAELSDSREEANVVLTTDVSDFDMAENEWTVSAKNGVAYLVSSTDYGVSLATDSFEQMIYDSDSTLSLKAGKSLSGLLLSKEDYLAQTRLDIYPEFPAKINRNYDYKVSVTQGSRTENLPVYNHTMEYHVDSRSIGGDLYRRFSTFAFSGEPAG